VSQRSIKILQCLGWICPLFKYDSQQKLEAVHNLYWTARELKAAFIRSTHPSLSEKEVQDKVKKIFLYATS